MLFVFLAAGSALTAAPAQSAPVHSPAQVSKPNDAVVAAAIRLLDADHFDEEMVRATDLMMGVSIAAMVKQLRDQFGDKLPEDLLDEVKTTVHDHAMATVRAALPSMKRNAAEIYAEQFSEAELDRLRELHSDPVAIKARERGKDMQPKLMRLGVQMMQDAQPDLDARIKRMIGDYVAKHEKSADPSS
jgi:hypothetical protein